MCIRDRRKEEAAALADGGDLYDALLDGYEPNTSGARIADMFASMRPRLVALREAVLSAKAPMILSGHFDETMQLQLSAELAQAFGYNLDNGRIDKAVHPFSSGSGQDCADYHAHQPGRPVQLFLFNHS